LGIKREGKNRIEGEAFLKEQAGKEEGSGFAPEEKKRKTRGVSSSRYCF